MLLRLLIASLSALVVVAPPPGPPCEGQGRLGLALGASTWCFESGAGGWALGSFGLRGQPLEETAWTEGLIAVQHRSPAQTTNRTRVIWLPATNGTKHSDTAATFAGTAELASGTLSFSVSVQLRSSPAPSTVARVLFNTSWTYDGADGAEWLIGLPFMGDDMAHSWRSQIYPWAGNSSALPYTGAPLQYNGVPAVTIFRPDWSFALVHALDTAQDVQNPNTWTGKTGYDFDATSTSGTSPRWLLEVGSNERRSVAVFSCLYCLLLFFCCFLLL